MTRDEARNLIIEGINYAAHRETDFLERLFFDQLARSDVDFVCVLNVHGGHGGLRLVEIDFEHETAWHVGLDFDPARDVRGDSADGKDLAGSIVNDDRFRRVLDFGRMLFPCCHVRCSLRETRGASPQLYCQMAKMSYMETPTLLSFFTKVM